MGGQENIARQHEAATRKAINETKGRGREGRGLCTGRDLRELAKGNTPPTKKRT